MDSPALCRPGGSGQEGHLDPGWGEVLRYVYKVLTGKYFCRSHYAGLAVVPDSNEGGQDGNHGLSAPDVALEQTVHLPPAHKVLPDFLYDPFLGPGQFIGERLEAAVEGGPDFRHRDSVFAPAPDILLFQKG